MSEYEPEDETCVCEHCEQRVPDDETSNVIVGLRDEEIWCDDCVDNDSFTCGCCGDVFSSVPVSNFHTEQEGLVCSICRYDHYYACADCGELFHSDNIMYSERHDEYYCEYHYDDHNYGDVRGYHDGPSLEPLTTSEDREYSRWDNLLAGFELEVLGSRRDIITAVHAVDDSEDFVWLEEDSSVELEAPSHPFTESYWRKYGREKLETMCTELRSRGARAWDGNQCGFHVHLSKKKFTRLQRVKLWRLIYDNMDIFYKLSGRKVMDHSYASFEVGNMERQVSREGRVKCKDMEFRSPERYRAINFTAETIELRFMRGSLRPHVSTGAVDMAFSLFHFTATHSLSEMDWRVYAKWVESNKKKYPDLCELMTMREVLLSDLEGHDFHVDKVRQRSAESAKQKPWRSDYVPTVAGDTVMVLPYPVPEERWFMSDSMHEHLGKTAKLLYASGNTVYLAHEDGTRWQWPKSMVVLPESDMRRAKYAYSMTKADYSAKIGKPSSLSDRLFEQKYYVRTANVNLHDTWSTTSTYVSPLVDTSDTHSVPQSLLIGYNKVKQYG